MPCLIFLNFCVHIIATVDNLVKIQHFQWRSQAQPWFRELELLLECQWWIMIHDATKIIQDSFQTRDFQQGRWRNHFQRQTEIKLGICANNTVTAIGAWVVWQETLGNLVSSSQKVLISSRYFKWVKLRHKTASIIYFAILAKLGGGSQKQWKTVV